MKKIYLGLILVVLSLVTCISVSAQSESTWVQTKSNCFYTYPGQNGLVSDSTLIMGNGHPNHTWIERTIIQFDLSGIPKDAQIISATLTLFCEQVVVHNLKTDFLVYERICDPLEKSKVSYDAPPRTSKTDGIITGWPSLEKPFKIDITSFVKGWHQGTFPNYGILGFGEANSTSYAVFTSSTLYPNIIPSHKEKLEHVPKLTVVYQTK